MKKIRYLSNKRLYYEIAKMRTLFQKRIDLRDRVEARYLLLKQECAHRRLPWSWPVHELDSLILKGPGSFIKPNKPAWRIFEPEEIFTIKQFSLPTRVDIKIDGMRLQVHVTEDIKIFSEDEGLNKVKMFLRAAEDFDKNIPKGTILDTEGVMVHNGQVMHRTSFVGYTNSVGYDESKEEDAEFWVFDVLFYKGEDLRKKPLEERLKFLEKIPTTKFIKPIEIGKKGFNCQSQEDVLKAVKKVSDMKGSEGALIKFMDGEYVEGVHNKTWVKIKNLKEIDCLVVEIEQPIHQKGPLESKPVEGVYNYHIAAGPYSEECGKLVFDKDPKKVREVKGSYYAYLGKTFNTEIKVGVGEIIRIWTPEVNRYPVKESEKCFTFGVYEPKVLEHVAERNIPDSMNVLMRLSEETPPREIVKQEGEGHWITLDDGRKVFILDVKVGDTVKVAGGTIQIREDFDLKRQVAFQRWRMIDQWEYDNQVNLKEGTRPDEKSLKEAGVIIDIAEKDIARSGQKEMFPERQASASLQGYVVEARKYLKESDLQTKLYYRIDDIKMMYHESTVFGNGAWNWVSEEKKRLVKERRSNSMYLPRHSCMMIWSGIKTQIVKEKPFEGMLHKELYLCDDHYCYGEIELTEMYKMTRKQVEDRIRENRIFGSDWEDWPGSKLFYGYDFVFEAYFEPLVVSIPHGAQTFFSLEADDVKRIESIEISGDFIGLFRKGEKYDFVLHKHYGEDLKTHFDLRWQITRTSKEELNLYGDPIELKKGNIIAARHKKFEESEESLKSWMVTEGEHLRRRIRGVETPTFIDVVDHGSLTVLDQDEDKIEFIIRGQELKGHFIYNREPKAVFSRVDLEIKKDEKGPTLPEYDELAKEGEPLPAKFYKWDKAGEEHSFRFVFQRHYPTGKKEPLEAGPPHEEMHKYTDEFREIMAEAYESSVFGCDPAKWIFNKIETWGHVFLPIIRKIRDHLDLRMEANGFNIGLTIHPPVPGGQSAWESFRDRIGEEGSVSQRSQITPKYHHPKEWLTREGELKFPTRHTQPGEEKQVAHFIEVAQIDILDKGKVKYGVQRKNLHEYFFFGKHLNGRWVLRLLKIGKEVSHWAWLFTKPVDQKPLDPVLHRDSGYFDIDMVSQPSTEEREAIEQETQAAREKETE